MVNVLRTTLGVYWHIFLLCEQNAEFFVAKRVAQIVTTAL
jgi:hypothetical protein